MQQTMANIKIITNLLWGLTVLNGGGGRVCTTFKSTMQEWKKVATTALATSPPHFSIVHQVYQHNADSKGNPHDKEETI